MKVLGLSLSLMLIGCPSNKPTGEDCRCRLNKVWFPDSQKCATVFYFVDPCTQVAKDPVCGCNDKTYNNGCEANIDGIKQFEQGECK